MGKLFDLSKELLLSDTLSEYQEKFASLKRAVHKEYSKGGDEKYLAVEIWNHVFERYPTVSPKTRANVLKISSALCETLMQSGDMEFPLGIDPELIPHHLYLRDKLNGKTDAKKFSETLHIRETHPTGKTDAAKIVLDSLVRYGLVEKKGKYYKIK